MHNHVDVKDSVHLKVLDLVRDDGLHVERQTRHWVALKLSHDSLGRDLVHDCALEAHL